MTVNQVFTHKGFRDVNFRVLDVKQCLTGIELLVTWLSKRTQLEIADDIIFIPTYKIMEFTNV